MENRLRYKLADGEEIELELTLDSLAKLKEKRKEDYFRINNILLNGVSDIFEQIIILYSAYLCANIDNVEACMPYLEFEKKINRKAGNLTLIANSLL